MTRSQVHVRGVDPSGSDLQVLASLWVACRQPVRGPAPKVADVLADLRVALEREDVTAFIASYDGLGADLCDLPHDIGFLVLSTGPLLPLLGDPAVSIEHLYVLPQARRLGAAHALIARATTHAELVGAGQVSTSVPALGREGQRFFARLGFSPFVVRRVTSVPALRRRLTPQADPRVEATVTRRRSLRAHSRAIALRGRPVGSVG